MRDGEYDFAIRAYSHTISRFEGRAAAVETRMQAPVYHQHRPGLRREVRLGPLLEKCLCFRHGGPTGGYVEDPIRLPVEIAMAGPDIYVHELSPLFHIEAHRLEGRIEHAGVCGEYQRAGCAFQSSRQIGEICIGSSI